MATTEVTTGGQQSTLTKELIQSVAELGERRLLATQESVILYVAIIAIIALASAGMWIGVAGTALVLGLRRCLIWRRRKDRVRLDHFRHRFRELLNQADSGFAEMPAEDKAFLQKYEDSILYPSAVPEHEKASASSLEHIETLYREYSLGSRLGHSHPERYGYEKCKLCGSARRVREHLEGVLPKGEHLGNLHPKESGEPESARQTILVRAFEDIRRAIGRNNPEAMLRELAEGPGGLCWALYNLHNFGGPEYRYDFNMVSREVRTAQKLMAREGEKSEKR